MSIEQRSWRRRNRKPNCCDSCKSHDFKHERTEVDWAARAMKLIWCCQQCDNHVYVYAQREAPSRAA
jgi:hypothetical protein